MGAKNSILGEYYVMSIKSIKIKAADRHIAGEVEIPLSKSISNRALMIHTLSGGRVKYKHLSDAADTVESEESQWEIQGFLYDTAGNIVRGISLTQENMTGFTQAGTVDAICALGVPTRLAHYNVPDGLLFGLNPNGRIRAYIGDDTA